MAGRVYLLGREVSGRVDLAAERPLLSAVGSFGALRQRRSTMSASVHSSQASASGLWLRATPPAHGNVRSVRPYQVSLFVDAQSSGSLCRGGTSNWDHLDGFCDLNWRGLR